MLESVDPTLFSALQARAERQMRVALLVRHNCARTCKPISPPATPGLEAYAHTRYGRDLLDWCKRSHLWISARTLWSRRGRH